MNIRSGVRFSLYKIFYCVDGMIFTCMSCLCMCSFSIFIFYSIVNIIINNLLHYYSKQPEQFWTDLNQTIWNLRLVLFLAVANTCHLQLCKIAKGLGLVLTKTLSQRSYENKPEQFWTDLNQSLITICIQFFSVTLRAHATCVYVKLQDTWSKIRVSS